MVTAPVTTPSFHSHVLSLLANYSATTALDENDRIPFPLIPPLQPLDTFLTPNGHVAHSPVVIAPWIDLASPDPLIADISQQILKLEIAYAAFCGATSVLIRGPRLRYGAAGEPSVAQYARAVLEALNIGPFLQLNLLLPMVESKSDEDTEPIGSLATFAREEYSVASTPGIRPVSFDAYRSWDIWNVIRSVCNYTGRLSLGEANHFSAAFSIMILFQV